MPMTSRQLKQVTEDYQGFLPVKGVVTACEEAHPGPKTTCDICGRRFEDWGVVAAKQIVVVPAGRFGVRHYRLLVCRQGTTCRARRQKQIERSSLRQPAIVH